MRTRTRIRAQHRGRHLAETLYVRTPTGVVHLAGVHAVERTRREAEISDALLRHAQRETAIQNARAKLANAETRRGFVAQMIGDRDPRQAVRWGDVVDLRHHLCESRRRLEALLALPPVRVPRPLPEVSVFAPPLVCDRRTARAAQNAGLL